MKIKRQNFRRGEFHEPQKFCAAGSSGARRSHPSGKALCRAFTLIEVLLAVGISAIVIVALGGVLFSALRLRERTQAALDEAMPVDQALVVIRRDLQCVVPPESNGILTGDFKAGSVTSLGISQSVSVEMYTSTGVLGENEPWGDVQRVSYELKDSATRNASGKNLIRTVARNLLSPATVQVEDQPLLGGVESVKFLCFDGSQWLDTWDTTGATSANTNLPVAVRVVIQMAENKNGGAALQPLQILVPIDSQSRTNT